VPADTFNTYNIILRTNIIFSVYDLTFIICIFLLDISL